MPSLFRSCAIFGPTPLTFSTGLAQPAHDVGGCGRIHRLCAACAAVAPGAAARECRTCRLVRPARVELQTAEIVVRPGCSEFPLDCDLRSAAARRSSKLRTFTTAVPALSRQRLALLAVLAAVTLVAISDRAAHGAARARALAAARLRRHVARFAGSAFVSAGSAAAAAGGGTSRQARQIFRRRRHAPRDAVKHVADFARALVA